MPYRPGSFPWATLVVNVLGCLLIAVVMVLIDRIRVARPLLRPFLCVGVLGGFTTFSTFSLDVRQTVLAAAPGTALAYLGATVVTALAAVWVGDTVTTRLWDRFTAGGSR